MDFLRQFLGDFLDGKFTGINCESIRERWADLYDFVVRHFVPHRQQKLLRIHIALNDAVQFKLRPLLGEEPRR
jgi:hypothetical protein